MSFKSCLFCLTNAPATFYILMSIVPEASLDYYAEVYPDIPIYSHTMEEDMEH